MIYIVNICIRYQVITWPGSMAVLFIFVRVLICIYLSTISAFLLNYTGQINSNRQSNTSSQIKSIGLRACYPYYRSTAWEDGGSYYRSTGVDLSHPKSHRTNRMLSQQRFDVNPPLNDRRFARTNERYAICLHSAGSIADTISILAPMGTTTLFQGRV